MIQEMIILYVIMCLGGVEMYILSRVKSAPQEKLGRRDYAVYIFQGGYFRSAVFILSFLGRILSVIWGFIYLQWYMPFLLYFLSHLSVSTDNKLFDRHRGGGIKIILNIMYSIHFAILALSVSLWFW